VCFAFRFHENRGSPETFRLSFLDDEPVWLVKRHGRGTVFADRQCFASPPGRASVHADRACRATMALSQTSVVSSECYEPAFRRRIPNDISITKERLFSGSLRHPRGKTARVGRRNVLDCKTSIEEPWLKYNNITNKLRGMLLDVALRFSSSYCTPSYNI